MLHSYLIDPDQMTSFQCSKKEDLREKVKIKLIEFFIRDNDREEVKSKKKRLNRRLKDIYVSTINLYVPHFSSSVCLKYKERCRDPEQTTTSLNSTSTGTSSLDPPREHSSSSAILPELEHCKNPVAAYELGSSVETIKGCLVEGVYKLATSTRRSNACIAEASDSTQSLH